MTEQPDNHNPIDETFDEIVRDAASRQPTDAQWTAAHARLRRKLVEARMEAESRRRGFPFLRALAYACGAAAVLALIAVPVLFMGGRSAEAAVMNTPGQLVVLNPDGSPGALCPLEHTNVEAKIAGLSRACTSGRASATPTTAPSRPSTSSRCRRGRPWTNDHADRPARAGRRDEGKG